MNLKQTLRTLAVLDAVILEMRIAGTAPAERERLEELRRELCRPEQSEAA